MEPTTRCPLCFEVIQARAVRCKHCQADLRFVAPPAHASPYGPAPYPYPAQPAQPAWSQPPSAHGPAYPPAYPTTAGPYPGPAAPPGAPPQAPGTQRGDPPPSWTAAFPSGTSGASEPGAPPWAGSASDDGSAPTSRPPLSPPPPREAELLGYVPPEDGDFEQRFLDFAFRTNVAISGASVAYALKVPIDDAIAKLEDLAARDVLIREVDARGFVFFHLPGRPHRGFNASSDGSGSTALAPYAQPPALLYDPPPPGMLARNTSESTALVALLVNALCPPPGIGSLIGGKTSAGVFQILLFVVGLVFCASVVGLPVGVPMVFGSWIWGLVTGVNTLNESKQNPQPR